MLARTTIKLIDVAKAAGVSQGTASNAFSRPEIVRPEVRERVHAAAEKLGYRGPDLKGRLLRAGKVNAIGVATAEPMAYFFHDPYARELMAGMSEACDARGAGMALISTQKEQRLAWNVQSALVDGLVLLCIEGRSKLVDLARERGLPFVALGLSRDDGEMSLIGIDNLGGGRMAGEHLTGLGHRRFGVLAMEFVDNRYGPIDLATAEQADYGGTRDRLRGYLAALDAVGIAPGDVPIYETHSGDETVISGLAHLFERPDPPTALLAMSDRIALMALEWLSARGMRVPHDVSVVGFDGVPEAETSMPALTTIVQPIRAMGQRAVAAIIDGDGKRLRETMRLDLVVRGSTAAPRG